MPKHAAMMHSVVDAISIRFNNMVYEMKQQGKNIIVLSLGEAFFDIPLLPFDNLPFPDIYHYSHSRGVPALRQKISQYYKTLYNVNIDPSSEMLITAGSKIAIYMVFKAILNPGDEVLIPEPAWVSYTEQVKLCLANPITIPYWETVYNYDKYITAKTKIIVINNPNNPSGKVYTQDELKYLSSLCREKGLYLLSDEAYSDFVTKEEKFYSAGIFDLEKNNTIICNSISKNFGISGWRIGYIIANQKLTQLLLMLNQHLVTCAPTILQHYLAQNFEQIIQTTLPQIRKLIETREEIAGYMDQINLKYLASSATFYFFVSIAPSKLTSEDFCTQLLQKEQICAVPGIGYGKSCDSFIRVSIGTESPATIKHALDRIKQFINATAKPDLVSHAPQQASSTSAN